MNQSQVDKERGSIAGDRNDPRKDSDATRSTISVESSAEVTALPDTIQFTVSIYNSKETVEDAMASVKRRTDYITQVIRKNGVKNDNVIISTEITKGLGSHSSGDREEPQGDTDQWATVSTDVVVNCDTLLKCETIRNVLIEKLDSSVQFSNVTFSITAEAKQDAGQEAFKRAVTSAKAKAECISQTVGVQLGPAIEVKELEQSSEAPKRGAGVETHHHRASSAISHHTHSTSLHHVHTNSSITFNSRVFVCFETQPLRISGTLSHPSNKHLH